MKFYFLPTRNTTSLLAALLVVLPAQAAVLAPPGAGTILQQILPVEPAAPSSSGTGLTIERENDAGLPPSAPFVVKTVQITGDEIVDAATLHALVADAEGKPATLGQLSELVARITDYFHSQGYPLARAIIPAQTIRDGVVVVRIIVAHYGKVSLDNRSQVNDSLLQATLSPLQNGHVITQAGMDHSLLLLSDIPGVAVKATLKPGDAVGTSDMMVETESGQAVTENAVLDNYGNRYTGKERIGGTVNFIDPLHHGDILSANVLSSGSGMNYGRISYESLLNGQGTRLGASLSALHYILGGPLSSLDGHGTADVESIWAKHPIIRSRDLNLYGQIQYDHQQLDDHIDATSIVTDRHLDGLTASLSGDLRDAFFSGGVSTWNLGLTSGRLDFDNATAQAADAATARTEGEFFKLNANFSRMQSLSQKNGLYFTFSGQWADTNLDASEKMVAGGPYTVRAYDMGAVSGDIGILGTVEFRHDMGQALNGQWQAIAFLDSEHVMVNKTVWVAGTNSATLTGAGVGLNWTGPDQWTSRLYIATPVGSIPTLVVSTESARAWFEIGKGF